MFRPKTDFLIAVAAISAPLLLWAPASLAEIADREKPINLEANQVTVDDARQISTFTGNVRLSQGTLLILGDKVVVEQDKEGYISIIAHGDTASFRQKREAAEGYIEGYGERIEYDAQAETMYLDGQARLKRNLDEVVGEHITYNSRTELFQVNADEAATDFVQQRRVRVVIQPKQKDDMTPKDTTNSKPAKAGDNMTPVKE